MELLLVEPFAPKSPDVQYAVLHKDELATQLVSTAATVKDKITAALQADGIKQGNYLISNVFSEATLKSPDGTELLGGEGYSFICSTENGCYYLAKSNPELPVYKFDPTNNTLVPIGEQIDVAKTGVDPSQVEEAMASAEVSAMPSDFELGTGEAGEPAEAEDELMEYNDALSTIPDTPTTEPEVADGDNLENGAVEAIEGQLDTEEPGDMFDIKEPEEEAPVAAIPSADELAAVAAVDVNPADTGVQEIVEEITEEPGQNSVTVADGNITSDTSGQSVGTSEFPQEGSEPVEAIEAIDASPAFGALAAVAESVGEKTPEPVQEVADAGLEAPVEGVKTPEALQTTGEPVEAIEAIDASPAFGALAAVAESVGDNNTSEAVVAEQNLSAADEYKIPEVVEDPVAATQTAEETPLEPPVGSELEEIAVDANAETAGTNVEAVAESVEDVSSKVEPEANQVTEMIKQTPGVMETPETTPLSALEEAMNGPRPIDPAEVRDAVDQDGNGIVDSIQDPELSNQQPMDLFKNQSSDEKPKEIDLGDVPLGTRDSNNNQYIDSSRELMMLPEEEKAPVRSNIPYYDDDLLDYSSSAPIAFDDPGLMRKIAKTLRDQLDTIAELRRKNNEFKAKYEEARRTAEDLRYRVRTLGEENTELRNRIDDYIRELDSLRQAVQGSEEIIDLINESQATIGESRRYDNRRYADSYGLRRAA